jgi:heme o synthase
LVSVALDKEKMKALLGKLRLYLPLIKSLQTALLLTTGLAGYMSARCPVTHWTTLLGLAGSLFLSISGSTVLNMWYDRDIDRQMKRTCKRPLAAGMIGQNKALGLGLGLSIMGIGWAMLLQPLYGVIVFAGLFFDVVVYTIWLKRRTCWSILWGGLSGGMPILAGRALALGVIDWIGVMLALSVLFWIPTHILTFSLKHRTDYATAGIPTFPSTYGVQFTRATIVVSCILVALSIGLAAYGVGMTWGYLRMLIVLSAGLLTLAAGSILRPSERANFGLFKFASLYMLSSMLLIVMYGL